MSAPSAGVVLVDHHLRGRGAPRRHLAIGAAPATRSAVVFDSGIYTVVLADDARAIPAALQHVPVDKRPPIHAEVFDFYARRFPGWPVALCCFSADVWDPPPLLWWYEPLSASALFAPGLDAHDGGAPRLDAVVEVDHTVFFGSHRLEAGVPVGYAADLAPAVRALLPARVVGARALGPTTNGDFVADLATVLQGEARYARRIGVG